MVVVPSNHMEHTPNTELRQIHTKLGDMVHPLHKLHQAKVLAHTNKVVATRNQGTVNNHNIPVDNLLAPINNHPHLGSMVVANKVVTNKGGTKDMVTVVTHHQLRLRRLGTVKVMVASLQGMVDLVGVDISPAVTSNTVVDLTRGILVMVVETKIKDMVIVVVTVGVTIEVVVVMIAMVTVVGDMVVVTTVVIVAMVVLIEDMVIKVAMEEGMYFLIVLV